MIVQILSEEIKIKVRRDDEVKLTLAKVNNVKVASIDRWLREDDVMLTTVTNLQIIRKHFSLPEDVQLTEEKDLQAA